MKLKTILNELLDPKSSEAYELGTPKVSKFTFSDGSSEIGYTFEFKNAKGNKMDITMPIQMEAGGEKPVLTFSFGKAGRVSATDDKYHTMTGAGDLNKILATLIKAADIVIDQNVEGGRDGLYAVSYSPADGRRDRIYKYFIQKYFPNFELSKEGSMYTMFVNQNYQPPQSKTSKED